MSIALAGAHRTGKSTLASAFAKSQGFAFVPSRAAEAFGMLGLRVSDPQTSEQRLAVQTKILEMHVEDIQRHAGQGWIADRSALDMAAYMLTHAAGAPDCDHAAVASYVTRCFEVANHHYGVIVLVQPGIPFVAAEGKPPPNPAQQELLNLVLWGLLQDSRLEARSAFLRRDVLDLRHRLKSVQHMLDMIISEESETCTQAWLH